MKLNINKSIITIPRNHLIISLNKNKIELIMGVQILIKSQNDELRIILNRSLKKNTIH